MLRTFMNLVEMRCLRPPFLGFRVSSTPVTRTFLNDFDTCIFSGRFPVCTTSLRPLYFHIAFPEQVAVRLIALIDFVEHDLVIDVADVGDARSAINIVTRRKETR